MEFEGIFKRIYSGASFIWSTIIQFPCYPVASIWERISI